VTVTGEVTDDELAAIYTGAHAVVFPSGDEGFGLTPVESLACGTPVAACDIPAMREVLDERAALTPRDDLAALIRAAEEATRPAAEPCSWSWDDAAAATWDLYESAAHAPVRWRGARTEARSEQLLHSDVLDRGLDELLAARDVACPVV